MVKFICAVVTGIILFGVGWVLNAIRWAYGIEALAVTVACEIALLLAVALWLDNRRRPPHL